MLESRSLASSSLDGWTLPIPDDSDLFLSSETIVFIAPSAGCVGDGDGQVATTRRLQRNMTDL